VAFKSEEAKETCLVKWRSEENPKFEAREENVKTCQEVQIEGIPSELETNVITEYLKKYFKNPRIKMDTIPGTRIETDSAKIFHEGPKRPIGKRLYIAPNTAVMITSASTIPYSSIVLKCASCLEEGHLAYGCEKESKCNKCRKSGHFARDCERCPICKKFGHNTFGRKVSVLTNHKPTRVNSTS
jgi:hypothetical protein